MPLRLLAERLLRINLLQSASHFAGAPFGVRRPELITNYQFNFDLE